MRKKYYLLDVFARRQFEGNPLAVFVDGEGLTECDMQKIAAEMNLSETVFVFPPTLGGLKRLRIFTPRRELPLAGHPVIGAWTLLAHLGAVPVADDGTVVVQQELTGGLLPVRIEIAAGRALSVMMTQLPLELGPVIGDPEFIDRLAGALGLERAQIAATDRTPVRTSSTGIVSLDVPVDSLNSLKSIRINGGVLGELCSQAGAIGCHAFSLESLEPSSSVHARFFAPEDNIPEDAATGSASGSLAGYLVHHGVLGAGSFTIEQGDFMGRPSRIGCEVEGGPGAVGSVRVGGRAVIVAEGEFFLGEVL